MPWAFCVSDAGFITALAQSKKYVDSKMNPICVRS